jgi:starvation-inducible DNA-binding protein
MLVDLVDLSLLGRQLHWSVVGRDFPSLHLQLDEFVDAWHGVADTVAERAVAIGHFPDGQSPTVATQAAVAPVDRGPIGDADVVRLLTRRIADVSERARGRMDRLGELKAALTGRRDRGSASARGAHVDAACAACGRWH